MNTLIEKYQHALLEKYRCDGKRYWMRYPDGKWLTLPAVDIALSIRIDLKTKGKEAMMLRQALKHLSKSVDDPAWRGEVAWLEFTKGRKLYLVFDRVEFCDPYSGDSKRSMKTEDFNRVIAKRFPNKRQVPQSGMAMLFW